MNDPAFTAQPWPEIRNVLVAFLNQKRRNPVHAAGEVDVTDALAAIRAASRELRIAVSFHAWALYCIVQAARQNPIVHTYRYRGKLITFDDIDVLSPVDKKLPNGVRIPVGHILRGAQKMSLAQINHELREAVRAEDLADDPAVKMRRKFARMPAPLRHAIAWYTARNPFWLKRSHGTLLITNIRTHGFNNPIYPVVPTLHTCTVAIGTTLERLRLNERGEIERRTMLCMSGTSDHDIVDGAGAAGFTRDFMRLMESAAGLDRTFIDETRALLAQERKSASAGS